MPENKLTRVIDIIAKSNSLEEIGKNLAAANLHIIDAEACGDRCFIKAYNRGIPSFTLIATDPTAAKCVSDWLLDNPQLTPERQQEVVEKIAAFNTWPDKKTAD